MNTCCFSRSAGARSFLRNNMLQNSYLPCCVVEKSRCHVCRGFACFWVFVCWLTPIPLTVLCVSPCSDGLLDFHMVAELVWLFSPSRAEIGESGFSRYDVSVSPSSASSLSGGRREAGRQAFQQGGGCLGFSKGSQ